MGGTYHQPAAGHRDAASNLRRDIGSRGNCSYGRWRPWEKGLPTLADLVPAVVHTRRLSRRIAVGLFTLKLDS